MYLENLKLLIESIIVVLVPDLSGHPHNRMSGKARILLLLFSALSISNAQQTADHHCVWYAECGKPLNCPYVGPPKPLIGDDAQENLLRFCPDIYKTRKYSICYVPHSQLCIPLNFRRRSRLL